ncbi:hypothetical protein MCOR25_003470 [Pyricularia grisea]|nr:hypothetical protein MCOR25_003470 [Pyricularia grisea]
MIPTDRHASQETESQPTYQWEQSRHVTAYFRIKNLRGKMSHESAVPPNRERERGSKQKPMKSRQAIIKLAEDLIEHLPANRSQDPSAAASLLTSVRKHIKSISQQQPQNSLYGDIDIDRLGTNL